MARPAYPLHPTPPVLDAHEVLKRLPAEARAQLAWTQRPIEAGLSRLRQEELTDALVDEVVASLITALLTLGRAVGRWLAKNLDELLVLWMDDLRSREEHLTAFLVDEDSRDTLRWVLGWLRSFYKLVSRHPVSDHALALDDEAWKSLGDDTIFKSLYTGLVCFMAASEEARLGTDRERAQDLLDIAFLQLNRPSREAREAGLWSPAFPSETLEEGRARLLQDADRLRRTLDPGDWAIIKNARIHSLR